MKLVVATGNKHKLLEFERILAPLGVEVLSPADVGISLFEADETEPTFEGNARIKACAMRKLTEFSVVADDSGLCVDALGGRPGVLSARYLGDAPQSEKNKALLKELENIPDENRGAQFVCSICCVLQNGDEIVTSGTCVGAIRREPRGKNGFGYDPIFMVSSQKSFAELDDAEKDEQSHRGKALRAFFEKLKILMNENELSLR